MKIYIEIRHLDEQGNYNCGSKRTYTCREYLDRDAWHFQERFRDGIISYDNKPIAVGINAIGYIAPWLEIQDKNSFYNRLANLLNDNFEKKMPYEEDVKALILKIQNEIKLKAVYSSGFFDITSKIVSEDDEHITYSFVKS